MTTAEIRLLVITVFSLFAGTFVFKQDIRKNVVVFALGCLTGFLAQLPLGRHLNLYTPNISLYVSYVSVAVICAWGIGLVGIYATHQWLCRRFGSRSGIFMYLLSTLPVIVVLEAIGSNVIVMKLHNYTRFKSLLPALNAMHAPAWLYGYYLLASFAFYCLLRALRIQTEDWSGCPVRILGAWTNPQTSAETGRAPEL